MAYEEIVGGSWGNPHPYMSSMWDIFVPNPRGEKELQKNVFGAGYVGGDLSGGIQEERSPFGRLMQGIGIIGEPDPRPLTYYEQFLYEQGRKQKTGETQQTEKQRIGTLQNQLDLAQDMIESGATLEQVYEYVKDLPPSMRGGLERQATERGEDIEYLRTKREYDILGAEKDIQYKDFLMRREGEAKTEQQHLTKLGKLYRMPIVKLWADVYTDLLEQAAVADPQTKPGLLAQANEAHKMLQRTLEAAGADKSEIVEIAGEPPVEEMFMGFGTPRGVGDQRIFRSPEEIDRVLSSEGYPAAAPTATPEMRQTPQPTPTIPMYQGGGGY